jgi:hypothetical protein
MAQQVLHPKNVILKGMLGPMCQVGRGHERRVNVGPGHPQSINKVMISDDRTKRCTEVFGRKDERMLPPVMGCADDNDKVGIATTKGREGRTIDVRRYAKV